MIMFNAIKGITGNGTISFLALNVIITRLNGIAPNRDSLPPAQRQKSIWRFPDSSPRRDRSRLFTSLLPGEVVKASLLI